MHVLTFGHNTDTLTLEITCLALELNVARTCTHTCSKTEDQKRHQFLGIIQYSK
jgi:hypothetical protein